MSQSDQPRPALISRDTLVPLGAALVVAATIIGGVVAVVNGLAAIRHGVAGNAEQVLELRKDMMSEFKDVAERFNEVEDKTADRVYRAEIIGWIELLKLANKGKDIEWPNLPGHP